MQSAVLQYPDEDCNDMAIQIITDHVQKYNYSEIFNLVFTVTGLVRGLAVFVTSNIIVMCLLHIHKGLDKMKDWL